MNVKFKKFFSIVFSILLCFGLTGLTGFSGKPDDHPFATSHFRLTLSDNGQVTGFSDLRSGINYADAGDTKFCLLRIHKKDVGVASNKMEVNGNMLTFSFPETSVTVKLRVTTEKSYLVFEVAEIAGGDFYSLQFARIPLTIDYGKGDFAACAMSRNLNTKTLDFPGKSKLLGGQCYSTPGYRGAGVYLLGMPETLLRETMKEVVERYVPGEMPVNRTGGPFAMDNPKNYYSYFINHETVTEQQVDKLVSDLSRFGVNQTPFPQGSAFRQGDFHFDEKVYKNGVSDFRKTSEAFHRHGFMIGLHTYSEFLSEKSKYVTPVPSKDLDVMRSFTLSKDLDAVESTVQVVESTEDVSEITGFFVRNSKVIRIDDELIVFGKPSVAAPYGFTSCERGAFGTRVSAHKKGAPVDQMTHMFFLFAPKSDSELFLEIARNTAQTYNEGGFDMIYLDALDGTYSIVEDRELTWYYEALFVNEILKYTKKAPLLEYSTFSPSLWYGRSRMGAWDEPRRGYRRFFDKHIEANLATADRLYLPGQMGWLTLAPPLPDNTDNYQYHIMFQEDVDYLGAKILAYNYGLSYIGIHPTDAKPQVYRNAAILKDYDSLRQAGYFSVETRKLLSDPNADFVLRHDGTDWYLNEANLMHIVLQPDTREFSYRNPYAEQTPLIRFESRYQPMPYNTPEGIDLLPLDETQPVEQATARAFEPPIDISKQLGLGVWIYGDGGGQRINIRLESPAHLASGYTDHIVVADFKGWRYFALAEADNGLDDLQAYPASEHHHVYQEFRDPVSYNCVSKVNLLIKGETANLRFRTIRALPLNESYLVDPALQTGNQKITFHGKIKNGHYMEYVPGGRAIVYDADGHEIGEMRPDSPTFNLPGGRAELKFSGVTESGNNTSVRITLRTHDEKPLR